MTELIIREARREDIEAIVSLQKQSLGEGLIPRNEAFWNWKHIENPFGASPVLLAWHGGQLVALRAFMNWQWKMGDQTFHALRAVDTATHPNWQGKGLFKKLTLQMIENQKLNQKDFIFNTPNKQSLPGYLKMGWEELAKPDLSIRIGSLIGFLNSNQLNQTIKPEWNLQNIDWNELDQWLANQLNTGIYTPKNSQYLQWRYVKIPEFNYFGCFTTANGGGLLIGRIKLTSKLPELRITELIGTNTSYIKAELNKMIKFFSPAFVSAMIGLNQKKQFLLKGSGFIKIPNLGPKVTLREVNSLHKELKIKGNWSWTTGDMELF
ncbi:GNAT family N-acetyltransferase [Peijinzhouia sedimentorum]